MTARTDSQIEQDATAAYQAAYIESLHQYGQDGDHAAFTERNITAEAARKAAIAPSPRKEPPMKSTTEAAPKHGAIPVYRFADNCDHPFRLEDEPGYDEWETDHPYDRDGEERICLLTPLDRTSCPACTTVAAEAEGLPMGEHVACRETTASPGSVNVTEMLRERGLLPETDEERAAMRAATAAGWDSMARLIKASTDDQLRARHPGIGDEDIARWREQASDPNPMKFAGDFWHPQPGRVAVIPENEDVTRLWAGESAGDQDSPVQRELRKLAAMGRETP